SGAKKAGSRRRGGPEVELDPADASLFEALRSWRGEQAKEQGVPAYVVFPDATLYGIVEVKPSTSSELGQVSGVGLKKLDRYGDSVLEVLAAHAGCSPPAPPSHLLRDGAPTPRRQVAGAPSRSKWEREISRSS